MIEIHRIHVHTPLRTSDCSICGGTVRVNPLKSIDTDVICKKCRCSRCSIPMSSKPCRRCGVAHGTPSTQPGLCELCFAKTSEVEAEEVESVSTSSSPSWSAFA